VQFFPTLTEDHRDFIARQPVFFVATTAAGARINLSPKGMDSFRVLDGTRVAYLDVGGSGNETNAHLGADGRITIMFCAFDRPALIFRIYGKGVAVLPQDDGWADLYARFTPLPGTRQIFVIDIDEVQTSCGWGVPFMTLERERATLSKYHAAKTDEERLQDYADHTRSIDGLPIRNPTATPA
jgi:hypothetical protein